jgi:hypothetical protein
MKPSWKLRKLIVSVDQAGRCRRYAPELDADYEFMKHGRKQKELNV